MPGAPPQIVLAERWFIVMAVVALMVQILALPVSTISRDRRSPRMS